MLKLKERELMYLLQEEMSRLRQKLRHASKLSKSRATGKLTFT